MNAQERYKLVLVNLVTGEEREALAKHADMLSKREAQAILRRTKGRMDEWEYQMRPKLVKP